MPFFLTIFLKVCYNILEINFGDGVTMLKKNIYVEKNIEILDLDKSIVDLLHKNEIVTIENLWVLNRKKLKEMGLKDNEIKQITIKLQLLGLDLNKRVYS